MPSQLASPTGRSWGGSALQSAALTGSWALPAGPWGRAGKRLLCANRMSRQANLTPQMKKLDLRGIKWNCHLDGHFPCTLHSEYEAFSWTWRQDYMILLLKLLLTLIGSLTMKCYLIKILSLYFLGLILCGIANISCSYKLKRWVKNATNEDNTSSVWSV